MKKAGKTTEAPRLLGDLVKWNARQWPNKPAILRPDGTTALTYEELERRSAAAAVALAARGVKPGDRVLIAENNTPEFFIAFFGALRAAAIAVPVDGALAAPELRTIVEHSQPACIVMGEASAAKVASIAGDRKQVSLAELASSGAAKENVTPAVRPGDLALLLYTSGTTGAPKGVMHSHETILHRLHTIRQAFGFDSNFRSLCLLPTHFGHGLICNCLSTFFYGGSLVLCRPFDLDLVRRVWQIVDICRVNTFSTVPAVSRLLLMADRRTAARPSTLRLVTSASAPLRPDEVVQFEERFGVPLLNCYGITETASWTAFSPNDPRRDRGSVGVAVGCDIRAVGPDGKALPPGEVGDLQVKGPSVMLGYYREKTLTDAALKDGWFDTGDIGRVDSEKRVFLLARKKEVINRGGSKVYPANVDAALMSFAGIAEAYALGISDPILGEKVVACVVKKPGATVDERQLIEHCRTRLAPYECPERIRFVEEVPKTSRGKVNRGKLAVFFA